MASHLPAYRGKQILAWAIFGLFVLGFFLHPVGIWTGPIMGVWLVGTQRPLRGILWLALIGMVTDLAPAVVSNWHSGPLFGFMYLGWFLLGLLPFLFHRLVSHRLPGLVSTLAFPLAGVAVNTLGRSQDGSTSLPHVAAILGTGAVTFLLYWFAALVIWTWYRESRVDRIAVEAGVCLPILVCAAGFEIFAHFSGSAIPVVFPASIELGWVCLAAAAVLGLWALIGPKKTPGLAGHSETLAILRSPNSGEPLQLVHQGRRNALVSASGERFDFRNGIPVLLKPEDLTGDNRKYNHLYETIGGFYDDIQRVVAAMSNFNRDDYVMSYMGKLEVKPGDWVLETSVGTGLNFKYLPRGVRLTGLDLSADMLANCQAKSEPLADGRRFVSGQCGEPAVCR